MNERKSEKKKEKKNPKLAQLWPETTVGEQLVWRFSFPLYFPIFEAYL